MTLGQKVKSMFRDAAGAWHAVKFDRSDLFMPLTSMYQYNKETRQQYRITSLDESKPDASFAVESQNQGMFEVRVITV